MLTNSVPGLVDVSEDVVTKHRSLQKCNVKVLFESGIIFYQMEVDQVGMDNNLF